MIGEPASHTAIRISFDITLRPGAHLHDNMHEQSPNHGCNQSERMSCAASPSKRKMSLSAYTDLVTSSARPDVTEAQVGSQGLQAHGMAYSPSSGNTPIPALPQEQLPPLSILDFTEQEIRTEIYQFIDEHMDPVGMQHASWSFQYADEKPPITPESLAELDMPRIINNPKLRHDVNFDRELHFRPNLDGSKGKHKLQQADHYWKALEAELVIQGLVHMRKAQAPENEAYWDRIMHMSLIRLPKIFAAIRDILKTLVPDFDQRSVQERLDVDHIMQEIQNGVCDLVDLGNWLAKVLKNHCAPMRDSLVDAMQKELRQGAIEGNQAMLVRGLRQLMTILEAMKLDVANHQIRHMRPLLIDDTINFQRRYNAHRIAIGKIDPLEARNWLRDELESAELQGQMAPSHLQALTSGLLRDLLYNDLSTMCPQTFYLDVDRLRTLRVELHGRIYQAICREVLREVSNPAVHAVEMTKACEVLQRSIAAIVGTSGRFVDKADNIAVEITRVALVIEGHYPSFDANLLGLVEQKLSNYLRPDSSAFRQGAMALFERLVPKVETRVRENTRLSALNLQDMLVPSTTKQSLGFAPPAIDVDDDVVRRFAHIIILHWQVWAELVYLAETPTDKEYESSSDTGSDGNMVPSAANSPTIPVAQAVYAPGRKWLPVSVTVTDVPSGMPSPRNPSSPQDDSTSSRTGEPGSDGQHRHYL